MSKFTNDKINIAISLTTMAFVAFTWWGDRNSNYSSSDATKTEQIKYLSMQVQELKESFKDLAQEVHGLMAQQYSINQEGKKNANF